MFDLIPTAAALAVILGAAPVAETPVPYTLPAHERPIPYTVTDTDDQDATAAQTVATLQAAAATALHRLMVVTQSVEWCDASTEDLSRAQDAYLIAQDAYLTALRALTVATTATA